MRDPGEPRIARHRVLRAMNLVLAGSPTILLFRALTAIMDCATKPKIGTQEVTVPLEITQREMNGIYLLALKGRLVLGDESMGFRTTVDSLLAAGATRIVVNLEHVNFVDSAGLGALIEAHRKAKANGGRLKLSNLGPNFKHALELAKLLPIFETCSTEASALAGF